VHNEILGSDIVTTLFLNYEWRRIVSEALQLYFDKQIRLIDDADIDEPRNQFQELINDLYTLESQVELEHVEVWRVSNQAIAANTDTAIIWTHGDFDGINPTRIYFPISGLATITVNIALLYTTGAVPVLWFRFNGQSQTDSGRERSDAAITLHYFNENWNRQVVAGQYVEVWVNTGAQAANVSFSTFIPRVALAIVGDGS
jgi:hypothetical protein